MIVHGLAMGRASVGWLLFGLLAAGVHVGCKGEVEDAGGTGGSAAGGGPSAGGSNGDGGSGEGTGGGNGQVPGTSSYDCTPSSGSVPELQATPVVTEGLDQPLYLTHEPSGDPGRLFVLERDGRVRIIEDGVLLEQPFLDFSSKVAQGGEQGALGLAFAPDYADSGRFYLHYSDSEAGSEGDSVFAEYRVSTDPNVADGESGRVVLVVPQPDMQNHKGGSIAFGRDGLLYLGLGDGGGGGDPDDNGQNVESLLGKILRIDPEPSGEDGYTIPSGNLWDTLPTAAPEIWDYGLRNPFRFSFDGCTGDLYIGDVGQNELEELDIERAGEGGKNYGWNTMEGKACYQPESGCEQEGLTLPALDYGRDDGQSITGGAVYRGSAIPGLRGTYFYADYQSNAVWTVAYDRDAGAASAPVSHTQELNNVAEIVAITNGADGELYFVSRQGGIFKLEAAQ